MEHIPRETTSQAIKLTNLHFPKVWKLNNTPLHNLWVKESIKENKIQGTT